MIVDGTVRFYGKAPFSGEHATKGRTGDKWRNLPHATFRKHEYSYDAALYEKKLAQEDGLVLSRASNPELLRVEKIQCADRHDYVTGP